MLGVKNGEKKMLGESQSRARAAKIKEKSLPKILPGSVQAHMVKCGRAGCRCERGELHGPYYYHYWRELGVLRKRYIKPADLADVQAMCAAGQAERTRQIRMRQLLQQTSIDTWRSIRSMVKQIEQLKTRIATRGFYGDDDSND